MRLTIRQKVFSRHEGFASHEYEITCGVSAGEIAINRP